MARHIELHLIQNFAPSNLNRDDTGAPKDALFGGYRRARISSQCLKRAIRSLASEEDLWGERSRGVRTKKAAQLIAERLQTMDEHLEETVAFDMATLVLAAVGFKLNEAQETQYLLFLGRAELDALVDLARRHWETLEPLARSWRENPSKKTKKKDFGEELPKEVVKQAKTRLDGGRAVDIGLFGRMLADEPSKNIDAGCQVAHAISTHRVDREFDYFTAMDDYADPGQTGAGMIDHLEFNSACFYRYAVLDPQLMARNLQGETELTLDGIQGFIQAAIRAIPSGKQNTFAAHNPPLFIGVSVRDRGARNLANAFEAPIRPKAEQPLSQQSVARLAEHERTLGRVYGESPWAVIDLTGGWPSETFGKALDSPEALADWAAQAAREALE